MPNTINLRLLDNKNIIAELNGIPLAQENSYRIIAGEENATQFVIASKPTQYEMARYTVEMVNSQGYGIEETNITANTEGKLQFDLPIGMAVAGYGWVQIRAYQTNQEGKEEKVPFMTLKIKVWNTLPNWKDYVTIITSNEKQKLEKIIIDGDGTKYLADDGTYKEVSGGGSNIVVDSELSDTSTNPVQNKVVKAELDKKLDINSPTTTGYPSYLYGYSGSIQKVLRYSVQGGVGDANFNRHNMIVVSQGTGQVKGAMPINPEDLTPKEYVDDTKADKEITHNGWKSFSGENSGAYDFTVRTGIEYNANAIIKGSITTISELSPNGVYKAYSYYCKASSTLTFDGGFTITFSQGASYEDELRCETNGYITYYSLSILTELTEDLHKVVKNIEKDTIANESKIGDIETALDSIIKIQNSLIGGVE